MQRRYSSVLTRQQSERGIDLNPMLDVVFILLIFFIVTAVFVREQGIDARPSPESDDPNPQQQSIIVKIDASNGIYIAQRYVDIRRVRANLERLHAQNPKASVVIDASYASTTNTLVTVMDAARLVGIYNISFAKR